MKAVILAGGLGTRLAEETSVKPKPLVEIGGYPILWHIMKIYSSHGINDFVVCCGFKGYLIKEYFANYFMHSADVTIDLLSNSLEITNQRAEPWRITLVDTGQETLTGGRLKRVRSHLANEEAFCFTYGDGVGDVNISGAIEYHFSHKRLATMTCAYPPGRFGALNLQNGVVKSFQEKPKGDGAMVNAGFFILSPETIALIDGDQTTWEEEPLRQLARDGELMAYEHHGYWQPMDTLQDKNKLNARWASNDAPWKVW